MGLSPFLDSTTLALSSMRFLIGQAPAAGTAPQLLPTRSENYRMPQQKLQSASEQVLLQTMSAVV